MRAPVAIVIVLGPVLALNATAGAVGKRARSREGHTAQLRSNPKAQVECERARHEDPTGSYAACPCWAREAFARGTQGNRE